MFLHLQLSKQIMTHYLFSYTVSHRHFIDIDMTVNVHNQEQLFFNFLPGDLAGMSLQILLVIFKNGLHTTKKVSNYHTQR